MTEADVTDRRAAVPARGALWTLRVLAVVGLGVAVFLVGLHFFATLAARRAEVPFCGWAAWLDCESVLWSPRYSNWFGVPVAIPAAVLYALVAVGLFALGPRCGATAARRLGWFLHFAAVCIAIAAVWFIYVQLAVLGAVCLWCMVEHTVGLMLGLLIWVKGVGLNPAATGEGGGGGFAPTSRWSAALVGMVAVGALIGGQWLQQPQYSRAMVGAFGQEGGYIEDVGDDRAVVLMGGRFVLNPSAHLLIGDREAERVIVEVIDYTCPRCRALSEMMPEALAELGAGYAVLVLTVPLSERCNRYIEQTAERHRDACFLANLAHAVWVVDPGRFGEFHHWLFEHQDEMTPELALAEAERLIGPLRLEGMRGDERPPRLLARDVEIAQRLGARQLPGLVAGDRLFVAVPDHSSELVGALREAFE